MPDQKPTNEEPMTHPQRTHCDHNPIHFCNICVLQLKADLHLVTQERDVEIKRARQAEAERDSLRADLFAVKLTAKNNKEWAEKLEAELRKAGEALDKIMDKDDTYFMNLELSPEQSFYEAQAIASEALAMPILKKLLSEGK